MMNDDVTIKYFVKKKLKKNVVCTALILTVPSIKNVQLFFVQQ